MLFTDLIMEGPGIFLLSQLRYRGFGRLPRTTLYTLMHCELRMSCHLYSSSVFSVLCKIASLLCCEAVMGRYDGQHHYAPSSVGRSSDRGTLPDGGFRKRSFIKDKFAFLTNLASGVLLGKVSMMQVMHNMYLPLFNYVIYILVVEHQPDYTCGSP